MAIASQTIISRVLCKFVSTVTTISRRSPRRCHTLLRPLCISKQNCDSSLRATLCSFASPFYRSLHQFKPWRLWSAVKGSTYRGRCDKNQRLEFWVRKLIVTGFFYWLAIWRVFAKRFCRAKTPIGILCGTTRLAS